MNSLLISLSARLLSLLPLSLNHAVGEWLAAIAWSTKSRSRRVTQFNLRHCFPDMSDADRQLMARESLQQTGKLFTECAWIWHRPIAQSRSLIRDIRGEQLLVNAVESERGVIVVSPHIGNWELCSIPLLEHSEFTYFYRDPRNPAMRSLLLKWRGRFGGDPATLDPSGIRVGLKVLKRGGMLGILPDQEPDRDNGVFAQFFNQDALTMTLLSRLAARSKAHVIFTVAERLPEAQGWRIHYLPASTDITSDDPVTAANAVNHDVERCIAICPTQYLWDYKRFNTLTDGSRRQYPKI